MYVLPDNKLRNRVVENRIYKSIERTPLYKKAARTGEKDVYHKGMITLFGIASVFVGAEKRENFFEFPAQTLIIDEHDECNLKNLPYAYDRLKGAKAPWIREIGNPTLEGTGIARKFEKSNGCEWFIRCEHCNHWQILDFEKNVLEFEPESTSNLVWCVNCHKEIDRLQSGEWVPARPDITDHHGYHIDPTFADPKSFAISSRLNDYHEAEYNPGELQRFWNNVIGKTYVPKGGRVDETIMDLCCQADYSMPFSCEGASAGVDVGSVLHVVITKPDNGKRRYVYTGTARDWKELHNLFVRFGVICSVIDAHPEKHYAREFSLAHRDSLICFYNDSAVGLKVEAQADWKEQTITIDRTESLDASLEDWQRKLVILPANWRSLEDGEFVNQMKAAVRVTEVNARGQTVAVWREGALADHYRHADNYNLVAHKLNSPSGFIRRVTI